jgi:hypothetical protein
LSAGAWEMDRSPAAYLGHRRDRRPARRPRWCDPRGLPLRKNDHSCGSSNPTASGMASPRSARVWSAVSSSAASANGCPVAKPGLVSARCPNSCGPRNGGGTLPRYNPPDRARTPRRRQVMTRRERTLIRLAWSTWAASLALLATGVGMLLVVRYRYPGVPAYGYWRESTIIPGVYGTLGLVIATRRPRHPVGCSSGSAWPALCSWSPASMPSWPAPPACPADSTPCGRPTSSRSPGLAWCCCCCCCSRPGGCRRRTGGWWPGRWWPGPAWPS